MTSSGDRPVHLLTVLHSAERTGPPLVALRFLRWVRTERPDWVLSTLALGGDPELLDDFRELGRVLVAAPADPDGSRPHRYRANWENARLRRRLERLGPFDLAHVHCAGSMRVLDVLPSVPVLCHIHELSVGLELHTGPRAQLHLGSADRYVAVSDSARDELVARVDLDPVEVGIHPGPYDPAEVPLSPPGVTAGSGSEFLVVASGIRHWRKAPELFVRAALLVRRQHPEIDWRFVWVGGHDDGQLRSLIDATGLSATVRVVEHRPDSVRWTNAADVLVSTAREDAFPLVAVEAAAGGTPIVSFDNGGAASLIRDSSCGVVVPYPDLGALVSTLADLAHDRPRLRSMAAAAQAHASTRLAPQHTGPRLLAELDALLDPEHPRRTDAAP